MRVAKGPDTIVHYRLWEVSTKLRKLRRCFGASSSRIGLNRGMYHSLVNAVRNPTGTHLDPMIGRGVTGWHGTERRQFDVWALISRSGWLKPPCKKPHGPSGSICPQSFMHVEIFLALFGAIGTSVVFCTEICD
jgi:hypothetical protein